MADDPIPVSTTQDPDLGTLLGAMQLALLYQINCHQVGQIVSFDPAKQTAVVQLNVLRTVQDIAVVPPVFREVNYPLLLDVPCFIPAGGTGRLTFPITAGDSCLVLFNDRDIDQWFATGQTSAPNTARAHDFSDGMAIIGFRNKANALGNYNQTQTELRGPNSGRLTLDTKIRLEGATTSLKNVFTMIIAALTALDGKTGPSASVAIASAQAEVVALMQ